MRLLFLAVVFVFVSGCTHTHVLDADDHDRVNRMAAYERATVVLADGETSQAMSLQLTADEASWVDPDARALRTVPLGQVAEVRLLNRWQGAAEGALFATVLGAVATGSVMAWSAHQRCGDCHFGPSFHAFIGGLIGGTTGFLIGLPGGALRGSQSVFFVPQTDASSSVVGLSSERWAARAYAERCTLPAAAFLRGERAASTFRGAHE